MAISQQELADAQSWIQNSGWGSFDPNGGFQIKGGGHDTTANASITGAAQSMGYSDADLSQILRGAFSADQIGSFKSQYAPIVDTYQSVFEADRGRASQPDPAPANLGIGGGSGGGSGEVYSPSKPNPYLPQMADDLTRRSNEALGQNLQSIRGNSISAGGLGGSRQGVAEGLAISGANDNLQGNLANLYGTDNNNMQNRDLQRYTTDQGNATQRYGVDQGNATQRYGIDQNNKTQQLNIGNNAYLTNQGQMQNFYTNNRQLDQSGQVIGANLYNQGNLGLIGQGQGVYGIGNTQQQAPWTVLNNTSGNVSPYTGYGATNTQTGTSGGGAMGALGGALGGAQIGKNLGLGGSSSNSNGMAMTNGGGFANMPNYMIQNYDGTSWDY